MNNHCSLIVVHCLVFPSIRKNEIEPPSGPWFGIPSISNGARRRRARRRSPAAAAESQTGLRGPELHAESDISGGVKSYQMCCERKASNDLVWKNAWKTLLEYSAPGLCLVGDLALSIHSWTPSLPGPYHTTWQWNRLDRGTTRCLVPGLSIRHLFAKWTAKTTPVLWSSCHQSTTENHHKSIFLCHVELDS